MPILPYNDLRFNRGNAQLPFVEGCPPDARRPCSFRTVKRWLFLPSSGKKPAFSFKICLLDLKTYCLLAFCQSLPVLGGVDLVIPSDVSVANNGRLSVGETASLAVDGVSRGAVISLTLENVSASSTVQASFQAERSPVTDDDGDGTTKTGQHIILLSCFSLYDSNIRGCGYYDHSRCKHRCQYL